MALSINWGVLLVGVLVMRAMLFGVHVRAPWFLQTPIYLNQGPALVQMLGVCIVGEVRALGWDSVSDPQVLPTQCTPERSIPHNPQLARNDTTRTTPKAPKDPNMDYVGFPY